MNYSRPWMFSGLALMAAGAALLSMRSDPTVGQDKIVGGDSSRRSVSETDENRRQESPPTAEAKQPEIKWKSLFDGKTLKGWKAPQFGGEGESQRQRRRDRHGDGLHDDRRDMDRKTSEKQLRTYPRRQEARGMRFLLHHNVSPSARSIARWLSAAGAAFSSVSPTSIGATPRKTTPPRPTIWTTTSGIASASA